MPWSIRSLSLRSLTRRLRRRPNSPAKSSRTRLALEALERRDVPTGGALDTSFSDDGKLLSDHGFQPPSHDIGLATVVQQADGKIIVGGYSDTGYNASATIVRFNVDGTLDGSFGTAGRAVLGNIDVRTLQLQPDGKILVAGGRLARLNTDGSLDATFGGGDGIADVAPFSAAGMVVQSDGRIVIGGGRWGGNASIPYGNNQTYTYGHYDFALARYHADGTLDASFDGDGVRQYDFGGGSESGAALALGPGDTLVLAGQRNAPIGTATSVSWSYSWAAARFTADGTPDTTFSGDGWQTLFNNTNWARANAVAVQADGKVVLAGESSTLNGDFNLARLNADGTPDAAFDGAGDQGGDGDGVRRTDFGGSDYVTSLLVDTNGRIVAAGRTYIGATGGDFALARFNPDGTPDASFGIDGRVTTDFGGQDDHAYGVAVAPGGKLVAAGYGYQPTTGSYYSVDMAAARYDGAGVLDTTFSGDGKATADVGLKSTSDDLAFAVTVQQPDGKVLVGGYSYGPYGGGGTVVRYNTDGTLDESFGAGGRVVFNNFGQVRSLRLLADGRMLAAGDRLARLNTDGSLDATFGGGDGIADDAPLFAAGMVVQSDGRIVIGGGRWGGNASIPYGNNQTYTYGHSDFALARYHADGTLDASFDGDGVRQYDFGGSDESGAALALGPGDTLVLAGQRGVPTGTATGVTWSYSWAAARFTADGTPDLTFSGDGLQTGANLTWAQAVAVQSDGKVVLAGGYNSGNGDFLLVRLNADGSPDAAFDGAGDPGGDGEGVRRTDFGGSSDHAYSVLIDADGRIVAAGHAYMGATGYDFALARFNPDGTPDASFGIDGKTTTDFGSSGDVAYGVAAAPGGKLVVAGWSDQSLATYWGSSYPNDIVIARYDGAGALDTSFSGDGKVTTELGVGTQVSGNEIGNAVTIQQPDGKVLVGGYGWGPYGWGGRVARYNADGTLDTGFGQGGWVFSSAVGQVRALRPLADGSILVAGDRLARLNADGSLDATFGGGDGIADVQFQAQGMVVQSDGKIVIGGGIYRGSNDNDFALARYNADGTLDVNFDGPGDAGGDGDGVRSVDFGGQSADYAYSVALGPGDTLVLAGQQLIISPYTYTWAVARFTAEGELDTSFSGDGLQTGANLTWAQAVAVQSDGKVVLAGGYDGANGDLLVVRLNADGTPDAGFDGPGDSGGDGDGAISVDFGGSYDWANAVVVDGDGRITAAGAADMGSNGYNYDFALVRFNPDGSLDTTFDGDGKVTTDFGSRDEWALGLAIQSDGKLVVAGTSYQTGTGYDFALARYLVAADPLATSIVAAVSAATPLYGVDGLTLSATVSVVAPGTGTPTGTVTFYDGLTALGTANLVAGVATLPLDPTALAVGPHTIRAVYDGDNTFAGGEGPAAVTVLAPSSVQGLVYVDFNDDGDVNFGEQVLAGVTVSLSGFDDLGTPVSRTAVTDVNGVYWFTDLRPSNAVGYTITESAPAGLVDGRDTLGTVNGVAVGSATVNDVFSGVVVAVDGSVAENYNFGERPATTGGVVAGQTAAIGFWQNKHGQALIKAVNGGPTATQLGSWLATTFANLYAALDGKTNAEVALHYKDLFARTAKTTPGGPPKVDAQVMATALAVYVTNQSLAGTTAAAYGFQVTATGVGTRTFNVGANGAAFGVANNSAVSVLDLLLAVNARSHNGVLFDMTGYGLIDPLESAYRTMANDVFGAINEAGGN